VDNVNLYGNSAMFQVTKLGDLVLILEHFKLYPLKTQKYADFLLLLKAFENINAKKHLTIEGLHELISIRASLNKGLPLRLKKAFPSIKPVLRPEVSNLYLASAFGLGQKEKGQYNSNICQWLAGFVSGEGTFFIQTSKSKTHKLGISVALNFYVVQNIRDSYLATY
jgi:LAGLIDADG DNA endonuclease family protein